MAVGELEIENWAKKLGGLYINADSDRRPEECWNAVMAHISGIGESIRKTDYPELMANAARAFTWIVAYVHKCNNLPAEDPFCIKNGFTEIIGLKYPHCCGHCTHKPCDCDAKKMDATQDKEAKTIKLFKEWKQIIQGNKWKMKDWLNTFMEVYSQNNHVQSLESIGFHLLEEAGEEAKAVRKLVQLRDSEGGIKDITGTDIFTSTTDIIELVPEYHKRLSYLKKLYHEDSVKGAISAIEYTKTDSELLISRYILVKMEVITELADTFSWFCGVLLKVKNIMNNTIDEMKLPKAQKKQLQKQYDLEECVKELFGYANQKLPLLCYQCKKSICECKYI